MRSITIENINNNMNLNNYVANIDENTNYFVYAKDESVESIVSIKYLDWDSEIFNTKIGLLKVNYGKLNSEILRKVDEFCLQKKYECLFTKATNKEYPKMHILEACGFNLMDSIVTLKNELKEEIKILENKDFTYKVLEESDLQDVIFIIDNLYSFGRFFVDEKLDDKAVNTLYKNWIKNEIRNKNVDVIGIEYKGKLVGFMSCKFMLDEINKNNEGIISLVGIGKSYQGLGIGKKLMNYVLNYFYQKGITKVSVGTQIDNISALNFYIASGFRVICSTNSFHKWIKTNKEIGNRRNNNG